MNVTMLSDRISQFLESSESNILPELGGIKIFEKPLVAVASADDPLFLRLKEEAVVGEIHKTPAEWLPGAVSVISYFLPFTREIRVSNWKEREIVSTEWLYGRIEGEEFNNEIRRTVCQFIIEAGGEALAPMLEDSFKWVWATSNWSERHAAYIAGLGTFGTHRSLITEKGCSGRYGSVITNLMIDPTQRQYEGIYDNCFKCMACAKRCPADAIDESGKDHSLCFKHLGHLKMTMENYAPRKGCGKCITKVPCETRIPKKKLSRAV